jgi:transcriptional regulator with XRE-family HTH domain
VTPTERIGRNIRRIRRAADLSQEACAERAGLHRASMSVYEWGEREPKVGTLLRFAGALNVEPAALLAGVRWEPGRYGPGRFVVGEGES